MMWQEFLADQNIPFMIALCLFAAIATLEVVGLITGLFSFSHDFDIDADIDSDVDINHHLHFDSDHYHAYHSFMNWLGIGRVPLMVFVALFSSIFGVIGLVVNHITMGAFGFMFTSYMVGPLAFIATLPIVSQLSAVVAKLIPHDETSAITLCDLVGLDATITNGNASHTESAYAYAYDQYQNMHSFSVRALNESDVLPVNTKVRLELWSEQGYFFYATPTK